MVTPIKKIIYRVGFYFVITLLVTSEFAHATPELDRVYQLESVGWLKPYDNVDGIFTEFLDEQYTKYFQAQNRFSIKKLNGLEAVFKNSKTPYYQLIEQAQVLKSIAQKFRVESLIRTKVSKEGETYRFVLQWVYAPRGDVLSQFEFRYVDPGKEKGLVDSDLPEALQKALDQLITKLPFLGQITGIEGDTITVNLGRAQGVSSHEILVLYSLQGVKRHPIEKTIEEWRWQPIGKAQIENVEDSISFAKVIETEPGQTVARFQKIKEILPAPVDPQKVAEIVQKESPRLGWVAGNLGFGSYSRDVSASNGTVGRTGSGFATTFEVEGQLWLNSRWLTQASLSTAMTKYSPNDLTTGASTGTSYSGSASQFRAAAGYAFFPAKTIFDPIGWVHAGLKSTSYSLPAQAADLTGNSSMTSIFVGVGGEIPMNERYSAQLGIDLGLIKMASQTSPSYGDVGSSADLMLSAGATYRYNDRIFLRLLLKVNSQSMDFPAGESVSQKMFSLSPSVMYYF